MSQETSGLPKINRKAFFLLSFILLIFCLLLLGQFIAPQVTKVLLNIIWFFLVIVTLVFVGLGVMAILGLRKEVSKILDLFLQGSFTFLDGITFVRKLILVFISELQAFLIFLAPAFSYFLAFLIYFGLIYLYKFVGKAFDVTLITILLTVFLVSVIGLLTLPKEITTSTSSWFANFVTRIKNNFSDAFEILVLLFFLTIDSTKLFFLPQDLNISLRATLFGYDLMERGFLAHSARFTITLVVLAVFVEILRNMLRIIFVALEYYSANLSQNIDKLSNIKNSIAKSFYEAKDDIVKFITFTTVLFFVFLFFPRIKLFTMLCGSITAFLLDLLIPTRLSAKKGTDLIARVLSKIFKL